MQKFSLEENSEWIRPDVLAKIEEVQYQKSVNEVTYGDDFGSYKLLLHSGTTDSKIFLHNLTGKPARNFALLTKKIIKSRCKKVDSIADMGCGAGFITSEIANLFPFSNVYGYELSRDAII